VLLSLLQVDGGGGSALISSLDSLVGGIRKRREAFGRTGKTAESSATKACMKLVVVVTLKITRR